MAFSEEEFLGKLQAAFKVEAEEHLQAISSGLLELEKSSEIQRRQEIVSGIFRDAHSLKGAARAVNLPEIEMICQAMEGVFSAWKKRDVGANPDLLDPLHRAVKIVEQLLPGPQGAAPDVDPSEISRLQEELANLELVRPAPRRATAPEAPIAAPPAGEIGKGGIVTETGPRTVGKIPSSPSVPGEGADSSGSSKQHAVADSRSAPPKESSQPNRKSVIPSLSTSATQSSSSRRVSSSPSLSAEGRPEGSTPASGKAGDEAGSRPASLSQTLRISTDKLDALLLHAEELLSLKLNANQRAADLRNVTVTLAGWEKQWANVTSDIQNLRQVAAIASARRSATEGGDNESCVIPASVAARILEFLDWNQSIVQSTEDQLRTLTRLADRDRRDTAGRVDLLLDESKRLLMLPFSTLFAVFPKLVRELSRDVGKEVDLIIRGEEIEIDKRILEDIKDPLIHLLRNGVDHGIEKPAARTAAGKASRGSIELVVSQVDGNKVEILISDDGGGIDAASVRSAAVRHGNLTQAQADELQDSQSLMLIFEPDVSTRETITEISGRGLGLAIVREKVEKLGGRVVLETRLGAGTTFRLLLPLTLATFRGILVEVVQQVFVLPTTHVERVTSLRPDQIKTVEGREMIVLDDRTVSLVRLEDLLDLPRPASYEPTRFMPAVVIGSADKRVAMRVDAVLNEQEVLVKQLGKPLSRVRNIAGATVLGSGHAVPILNVTDLMKSAMKFRPAPVAVPAAGAETVRPRKSVLVVEDSITARMLLKNILESDGHRVKTAVDGVDAFALLRTEEFDLVVSDVEMPRMNGFDLTSAIRHDKRLAELPVVLVTALASREDRERGADVGANAYIAKGSFDQSNLVDVVRRLI